MNKPQARALALALPGCCAVPRLPGCCAAAAAAAAWLLLLLPGCCCCCLDERPALLGLSGDGRSPPSSPPHSALTRRASFSPPAPSNPLPLPPSPPNPPKTPKTPKTPQNPETTLRSTPGGHLVRLVRGQPLQHAPDGPGAGSEAGGGGPGAGGLPVRCPRPRCGPLRTLAAAARCAALSFAPRAAARAAPRPALCAVPSAELRPRALAWLAPAGLRPRGSLPSLRPPLLTNKRATPPPPPPTTQKPTASTRSACPTASAWAPTACPSPSSPATSSLIRLKPS